MSDVIQRKLFILVPGGSTLMMHVTSQDEGFEISGEAARNGQSFKTWKHNQLVNKTIELPLASPDRYILLLQMAFTGSAPATVGVMVIILKPDGTVHSEPWAVTFTGKKGDTGTARVSIITQKIEGGDGDEG